MKNVFISLLNEVKRPGIPELLQWIDTTDFYTAPASTRHHGAVTGGLLIHSLAVYDALLKINEAFQLNFGLESMKITALLHDLCKANYYTVSTRNAKNEKTGQWEKVPYYSVDDKFPAGHGEKSIILLQRFVALSDEEALAIRFHMGGFDDAARGGFSGSASMGTAMDMYPLVSALHLSDMAATYFYKK